jgi:hypothetical protein
MKGSPNITATQQHGISLEHALDEMKDSLMTATQLNEIALEQASEEMKGITITAATLNECTPEHTSTESGIALEHASTEMRKLKGIMTTAAKSAPTEMTNDQLLQAQIKAAASMSLEMDDDMIARLRDEIRHYSDKERTQMCSFMIAERFV